MRFAARDPLMLKCLSDTISPGFFQVSKDPMPLYYLCFHRKQIVYVCLGGVKRFDWSERVKKRRYLGWIERLKATGPWFWPRPGAGIGKGSLRGFG